MSTPKPKKKPRAARGTRKGWVVISVKVPRDLAKRIARVARQLNLNRTEAVLRTLESSYQLPCVNTATEETLPRRAKQLRRQLSA